MIETPLNPLLPARQAFAASFDAMLGDAVDRLGQADEQRIDKAVHESRKRVKEARALLRLCRRTLTDEAGVPVYADVNPRLRDAARLLGEARDAAVLVETLDELTELDLPVLRERLVHRHRDLRVLAAGGGSAAEAATRLAAVRREAAGWYLASDGFDAFAGGLRRCYARGRRDLRLATQSGGDAETWHDGRKRAKDLRFALELLSPAEPDLIGGFVVAAKRLGDLIGWDHDLAVLAEVAERTHIPSAEAVAAACEARRAAARREAVPLVRRLYSEPPDAFVRRLQTYWRNPRPATACDAS